MENNEEKVVENNDEKIMEALKTIKKYCNQFEECEGCKLLDDRGCCGIQEKLPSYWEINEKKEIRYFI